MEELRAYDPEIKEQLQKALLNDNPAKIEKWKKLFEDPIFFPKQDITLDEKRALAYKRLKKVSDAKLFSIYDFVNDPKNLFTAHEMLGQVDGSLATKFTV